MTMSGTIDTPTTPTDPRVPTAPPAVLLTTRQIEAFAHALQAEPSPALAETVMHMAEADRCALGPSAWRAHATGLRESQLGQLLLEDPFTEHACLKPRGYPGDAALLDRIYFGLHPSYEHGRPISALGNAVHSMTIRQPEAEAVRRRRERLAELVDEEAQRRSGLRVASIACGYAREAALSRALSGGRIAAWTCLDHDADCTRLIAFQYEGVPAIQPRRASIRRLLEGRLDLGELDLVYSAGLYDYLDDVTARSLTSSLFATLGPGGRLVIGNFASRPPSRGYIEAFMDWWLRYRTRSEVEGFADAIPSEQIDQMRVETCETGAVHYIDVRRR